MVDQARVVRFVQQRGDDADPGAVAAPAVEAAEDGLPRPVTLGEVTPRRAGVQDPEDPDDERTVVAGRAAYAAGMALLGEQRRDAGPLRVREFVAAHGRPPEIDR
jgi:hypothetical protein